jgi:hypothetical protein
MSDFVSSGWSLYVAGVTIVSLIACLVLLAVASKRKVDGQRQHHRPRLGRGPARDEQPAAALVDVAVHHHGGVRGGLPGPLSRAWAATPAR